MYTNEQPTQPLTLNLSGHAQDLLYVLSRSARFSKEAYITRLLNTKFYAIPAKAEPCTDQ
jgi:hypothetical protein